MKIKILRKRWEEYKYAAKIGMITAGWSGKIQSVQFCPAQYFLGLSLIVSYKKEIQTAQRKYIANVVRLGFDVPRVLSPDTILRRVCRANFASDLDL